MRARSILVSGLWLLSQQCVVAKAPTEDDQESINFESSTLLCFYEDLADVAVLDRESAPGQAACQVPPNLANRLSKRQPQLPPGKPPRPQLPGNGGASGGGAGAKPPPPARRLHWRNISRRGTFNDRSFPTTPVRREFADATRQFIQEVNLNDARTRYTDFVTGDYRMRAGWISRYHNFRSLGLAPEVMEIINRHNASVVNAPRGWAANAPMPWNLEVFDDEPVDDNETGQRLEEWVSDRLLPSGLGLLQLGNMEAQLTTSDMNFGFSYQILNHEEWQALEEAQQRQAAANNINNLTYANLPPVPEQSNQPRPAPSPPPPPRQQNVLQSVQIINGTVWMPYTYLPPPPPPPGNQSALPPVVNSSPPETQSDPLPEQNVTAYDVDMSAMFTNLTFEVERKEPRNETELDNYLADTIPEYEARTHTPEQQHREAPNPDTIVLRSPDHVEITGFEELFQWSGPLMAFFIALGMLLKLLH
ncbi:MAG: hypothetical protein M1831_003667 [Alyxoria varia]|nr:MAG: hypothetical protein M1831_003667 [Alyxoria varia]